MKKNRTVHSSPLFKQLKIVKLNDLCNLSTCVFVYKSLNNLLHSPIQFVFRNLVGYNLRNPPELLIPFNASRQSFMFIHNRGSTLWNELPQDIRNANTIYAFKSKLKKSYFDSY